MKTNQSPQDTQGRNLCMNCDGAGCYMCHARNQSPQAEEEMTMEEIFKDTGLLERAEFKGLIKHREKQAVQRFIDEYLKTVNKSFRKLIKRDLEEFFQKLHPSE